MKKVLLVLALVAVSGMNADVQQNWQDFKQKSKEIGQKVIDPINFPKYKKLLDVAQAELDACGSAKCGKLKTAKHYNLCVQKKCAAQAKMVESRRDQFKKRAWLVGGLAVAGATAAVGVAAGAAALQSNAQMKEVDRIFNEKFGSLTLNPAQANLLKSAIAYNKKYITFDQMQAARGEYMKLVGSTSVNELQASDQIWVEANNIARGQAL
jgi:hypothetical protein